MKKKKRMRGGYASYDKVGADGKVYRLCSFCGQLKPITDFSRNGKNPDGTARYRLDCRVCYNIRRKENKLSKTHSSFVGGMSRRGEENVNYTHQQWKETVIFFEGKCAYCGRTMRRGEKLTRDHLVPVSEGGITTQANIVPACGSCNSSKGAKEWREWFMSQPFFSQDRMNRIFKWRSIMTAVGDDHD